MATLRLRIYDSPRAELTRLSEAPVPHWAERLYQAHGHSVASAPVSATVLAAGEELSTRLEHLALLLTKAEALGWRVQVRDWDLLLHTGLDEAASRERLEAAGVWVIARVLAPLDAEGGVRWEDVAGPDPLRAAPA
ncbi:MAG: hypothetical protein ACREPA_03080 [Candidatus Dormibacteraceae bacterium]